MSGDDVEVRVNSDGWMDFLRRYGLNEPGSENCCEITHGSVKLSMIKEIVDDVRIYGNFHALRIGYYEPGETVKMSMAINDGTDPPAFSLRLRTAQQRFFNDFAPSSMTISMILVYLLLQIG